MKGDKKTKSIIKRMLMPYRITIIDDKTLAERKHFRINILGGIFLGILFVFISWAIVSLVLPNMQEYIPGHTEDLRPQLMSASVKTDSLQQELLLQRQYTDIFRKIMAGEVSSDSIETLDSIQLVEREELLIAKNQATEEFLAEQEAKEKENLHLFESVQSANTSHLSNFILPAKGKVIKPCAPDKRQYAITIGNLENKNASAVLDGTIIQQVYDFNQHYIITIQHAQFTSIYKGIGKPVKKVGDKVNIGQTIGIIHAQDMDFELWKNGYAVNPEEYIAF
jgi:murein DD-endopeptidase MepM/ murein hydrolase activator NlpD